MISFMQAQPHTPYADIMFNPQRGERCTTHYLQSFTVPRAVPRDAQQRQISRHGCPHVHTCVIPDLFCGCPVCPDVSRHTHPSCFVSAQDAHMCSYVQFRRVLWVLRMPRCAHTYTSMMCCKCREEAVLISPFQVFSKE